MIWIELQMENLSQRVLCKVSGKHMLIQDVCFGIIPNCLWKIKCNLYISTTCQFMVLFLFIVTFGEAHNPPSIQSIGLS